MRGADLTFGKRPGTLEDQVGEREESPKIADPPQARRSPGRLVISVDCGAVWMNEDECL